MPDATDRPIPAKRLFIAVLLDYARGVHRAGFVGAPRMLYDTELLKRGKYVVVDLKEFVEFRDLPPAGLTGSSKDEYSGGPMLADYMGDLILSIEVPDDGELRELEIHAEPPTAGPFREYWLPPEVANRYLDTLKVFVPNTEEEIPRELLGADHAVLVTERSAAVVVGALCLCGEKWRRVPAGPSDTDQQTAFESWSGDHL